MKPRTRLLAGLAATLAVAGIWWMSAARQVPPVQALRPGRPIVEVAVPQLDPLAKAGEALFNGNCAACHGLNAAGQDGVAPPLVHRIYEPGHHGDRAFLMAAMNGVRAHHWPFGNMPPVPGVSPDQVEKIVAYVRRLQVANGIY